MLWFMPSCSQTEAAIANQETNWKTMKNTAMYLDALAALLHKSTKHKCHRWNKSWRPHFRVPLSFFVHIVCHRRDFAQPAAQSQPRFAMQFAVPTFCEFLSASAKAALAFSADKRARCTANKEQTINHTKWHVPSDSLDQLHISMQA